MPQSEGGYVSLGNGPNKNVYNATTEPTGPQSVIETVKRAIGQVVSGNNGPQDISLLSSKGNQPIVVGSRDRDKIGKALNTKMPSAPTHTAEEARLLGTMPVDPMDDIELRSVQLQFPNTHGSIAEACDLRHVPTDKGDILVAIQGDHTKPAILTYHDLGLNYATSFAGFFNYPLMRGLLENFCVYHVTAPGQEEGAPTLPEDYVYPTMDELASQLLFVMSHFGLKSVIGFGVGAGANILARYALHNPDKVGALCLINCVSTSSGWIEWGYQSFNARFLRTKGMTQGVVDYLMWHHFGRNPEERNHDLVQMYKTHFERSVNPTNLAMLINSYIHRSDLNIARTPSGSPQSGSAATLKMPVINITGALSPHVDDTVTLNGRLDPTNSSWMKISDCAMVLEEQPGKLAEAFRLFLQGEGYAVGALQRLAKRSSVETTHQKHLEMTHLRLINISPPTSYPSTSNASLKYGSRSSLKLHATASMNTMKAKLIPILVHLTQSSNTKTSTTVTNKTATTMFINHDQLSKKPTVVQPLSPPQPTPSQSTMMKMVNNNNIYAFGHKTVPQLSPSATPTCNDSLGSSKVSFRTQQMTENEESSINSNSRGPMSDDNGNVFLDNEDCRINIISGSSQTASVSKTTQIGSIRITENPLPETVAC